MRRFITLLTAIAGLALFATPSAIADPPEVETDVQKVVTVTFENSEDRCTGEPGTTTVTFNIVVHTTEQGPGIFHDNQTLTGTFTFVPDDPSEPSYSGHFVSRSSIQGTPPGAGFVRSITSTEIAKTEDGVQRWEFKAHFTRLPSGEVVVDFVEMGCA
jgi:hypothetical protein